MNKSNRGFLAAAFACLTFMLVVGSAAVKADHPRVLFVGYGETDNWAHRGRYDLVLESAHGFDHFVQQLWEVMQSMPEYRDQTTFCPHHRSRTRERIGGVERAWR